MGALRGEGVAKLRKSTNEKIPLDDGKRGERKKLFAASRNVLGRHSGYSLLRSQE